MNYNKDLTSVSPESLKGRAEKVCKEAKAKVYPHFLSDTNLKTHWVLFALLSFLCQKCLKWF